MVVAVLLRSAEEPARRSLPASVPQGSWHILEEDVVAELQRLLCLSCPVRWFRHGGRVVMLGPASGFGTLPVYHLVGGDLRLSKLTEWDRLRANQVSVVRIVLVPAAGLVRFLANAGVTFPPPRLGLTISRGCGWFRLWRSGPPSSHRGLRARGRARMSRPLSIDVITFLQTKKYPHDGGCWVECIPSVQEFSFLNHFMHQANSINF